MKNFSPEYYENTKRRGHSPLLEEALSKLVSSGNKAVDLGCGAGRDTRFLAQSGFSVQAIDADPLAGRYIDQSDGTIRFVCMQFEDLKLDTCDFVNASYSLPFCSSDALPGVIEMVKNSLNPGGIFTGQLFGTEDEWNTPGRQMAFYTKKQILRLFSGMELLKIDEMNKEGTIANGSPKHWHVFDFIVRKPK